MLRYFKYYIAIIGILVITLTISSFIPKAEVVSHTLDVNNPEVFNTKNKINEPTTKYLITHKTSKPTTRRTTTTTTRKTTTRRTTTTRANTTYTTTTSRTTTTVRPITTRRVTTTVRPTTTRVIQTTNPINKLKGLSYTTAVNNNYISKSEYNYQISGNLKTSIETQMKRKLDYSKDRFYLVNNSKVGIYTGNTYIYNSYTRDVYLVTQTTKKERATWYSRGSKTVVQSIDNNQTVQKEFFDAMEYYGITEIYYYINPNKLVGNTTVRTFVKNAYNRNIKVYLLGGATDWLYPASYQEAIYNMFDNVVKYNNQVNYDERIAGVSYDNEVWNNKNYDWKHTNSVRNQHIHFIETAQKYADSKNLSVSFCLPYWIVQYDYSDESHKTYNMYDKITKITNNTIIMAYRDTKDSVMKLVFYLQPEAPNSLVNIATNNDNKITIALETDYSTEGKHVSLYEEEMARTGASLNVINEIENSLYVYNRRTSYALHHAVNLYEYYKKRN